MNKLELSAPSKAQLVVEDLYKDLWQMCSLSYRTGTVKPIHHRCTGWKGNFRNFRYHERTGAFHYGFC